MKTSSEAEQSVYINGDLKIDYAARCVYMKDKELYLTPIEYKLLCLLAKNTGKVLTHTYITKEIWGNTWSNGVASLRVFMATLRKKIEKELYASDAHELMRAAEVINLLDLGQALMISARERKESRGRHIRSDYTFTNPLLRDKFLRVWKEGDEVKTAWRDRLI